MASVISTAGLLTLMCVWFASLLVTADQQRVDAEQENFDTVALADGGASSTIFGACITKSREIEAKMYSIQLDGSTTEWLRMVPDNATLLETITWTDAPSSPAIATLVDCVAAAETGAKEMFKYGPGAACKLSAVRYTFTTEPACEAANTDAVFVKPLPR